MRLDKRVETSTAAQDEAAGARPVRRRTPRPDSAKRAPLAAVVPRPVKRTAGRTVPADTPAYIRAAGVGLTDESKAYVRQKLGRKLGKFARRVERASVRVDDVNGPRGGVDKRCRIKVVLSGLPSVVVEHCHESLRAVLDGALKRVERAVRHATVRSRAKARRPSKRAAARGRVRAEE